MTPNHDEAEKGAPRKENGSLTSQQLLYNRMVEIRTELKAQIAIDSGKVPPAPVIPAERGADEVASSRELHRAKVRCADRLHDKLSAQAESDHLRADLAASQKSTADSIEKHYKTHKELQSALSRIAELESDVAQSRHDADTANEDLRKKVDAYLNERACCSGQECGCGGMSRLEQIVGEEIGTQLTALRLENTKLREEAEQGAGDKRRLDWLELQPEFYMTRPFFYHHNILGQPPRMTLREAIDDAAHPVKEGNTSTNQ